MSLVDKSPRSTSEQEDYRTLAMQKSVIRGREILTYAPFRLAHSAYHTLSPWQEVIGLFALLALFYAILVEVIHQDSFLLVVAISLLTFLYLAHLMISVVLAIAAVSRVTNLNDRGVTRKDALTHKADWPTYTILCPLYKEARVVKQFIRAMNNLDYPVEKLQILLLVEEDDPETRGLLSRQRLPQHFSIVTVPAGSPRTKPRACNYGLLKATGAYVVIYDAEDIPEPWQLKMAALTFMRGDANLACVQAQLNTYNPGQNVLTRCFTIEYSLWFDLVLPGLTRLGAAIPLGGTSNHFRADVLRALGAWDAYNVTEDADLGMRLSQYGFTTRMIESTTYEEATSRIGNWIRQRSRWIKGYIQTYFVQWRRPEKLPRKRMLLLHFTIGATVLFFLLNPAMWILTGIYILDRAQVEVLYHVLFPTPVLYSGMICLIFGNVFYVYVAMIAAMRRGQYSLVKWCLLLPFYWALIFVAAVKAIFQLCVKPHYWEKTQHGSHLAHDAQRANELLLREQEGFVVEMEVTRLLPVVQVDKQELPRITQIVKAVKAPGKPITPGKRSTAKAKDLELLATMLVATLCSITATTYYYLHHETVLYGDAYSHLRIARSLFDNLTPGITQLGGVWLPLQHLLMVPFIWDYTLWQTGLAGSIPSMFCYVLAAGYLFCTLRRLTQQSATSMIGVVIFLTNPNILYLQSTPLSELICIAAFAATTYYTLRWIQEGKTVWLIAMALATFAASLTRYDGWALFLALSFLLLVVGLLRREHWQKIIAQSLIYTFVASLGIILWLIWCKMIFGDLLFFQHGPYSAESQQFAWLHHGALPTYHHPLLDLRVYIIDTGQTIGWSLLIFAVIGLALAVLLYRERQEYFILPVMLVPLGFYIITLYTGQSIISLPGAGNSTFFNVRYGSQMVLPIAFLITLGLATLYRWLRRWHWKTLFLVFCLAWFLTQAAGVNASGIISLQDGLSGVSCTDPTQSVTLYLVQHYNGGRILVNEYTSQLNPQIFNADFSDIVYEGSVSYWHNALANPKRYVDWVALNPRAANDKVTQYIEHSPQLFSSFLSSFELVAQAPNGLQLYHKKGGVPLPSHPIPDDLLNRPHSCKQG
jgi:cellulose synthase/poly-beta-1,6-N-acetylglucosamine synthase-like glycosyltransferase